MITILKRVLSVSEIVFIFRQMEASCGIERGYDMFCTILEKGLRGETENIENESVQANETCLGEIICDILSAGVDALSGKLVFEAIMNAAQIKEADSEE